MSTIEKLEKRLEKEPSSLLFVQLVEEYRKAGRIEEAIRICLRGLEHHPNYGSAFAALGKCYYDKGDLEKAKENLEHATAVMPDNIQAITLLVDIYEKLGYLDKALENLRLVQLLSPSEKIDDHIRFLEKNLHMGDESPTIHFSVSLIKESLSSAEEPMTVHMPKEELQKEIAALENTGKIAAAELQQAIQATQTANERERPVKEQIQEQTIEESVPVTAEEDTGPENFETKKYSNIEETMEKSNGEPVEILSLIKPDLLAGEEAQIKDDNEEAKEESHIQIQEITTQTLGEIYVTQGHYDKAIKIYQKIVLADPGNAVAITRLKQLIDTFNKINAQTNKQFFKEELNAEEPDSAKASNKGVERKKRISTLENWLHTIRKEKDLKIK
jgi:tetratricopeptide (TPR) repeat protein